LWKGALSCHGTKCERVCNLGKGFGAWVAPPPLVRCTVTPVAVPDWAGSERPSWGWSLDVAVYTVSGGTVHRRGLFGATASFLQRVTKGGLVTVMGTAVPRVVYRPIFLERGFLCSLAGWSSPPLGRCHRHLYGAPTGQPLEGHHHYLSDDTSTYPVPSQTTAQRGNDSICLCGYK
jgi:hypothetical protein